MKMTDVRKKAAAIGLETRLMKKPDMIRAIQAAEGNTPCFATGRETCDQVACCWRDDCLPKGH